MLFPSLNLTQKVTAGYGNELVSFLVVLTEVCLDKYFLPETILVYVFLFMNGKYNQISVPSTMTAMPFFLTRRLWLVFGSLRRKAPLNFSPEFIHPHVTNPKQMMRMPHLSNLMTNLKNREANLVHLDLGWLLCTLWKSHFLQLQFKDWWLVWFVSV